jgi:hypothetical protein
VKGKRDDRYITSLSFEEREGDQRVLNKYRKKASPNIIPKSQNLGNKNPFLPSQHDFSSPLPASLLT